MATRRRGFFAEMAYQQRLAEQRQRKVAADHTRLVRQQEQAVRKHERAVQASERASAREQAAAVRAERTAYVEAQKATAEAQTTAAIETLNEIDAILSATLEVDDYVDVNSLRVVVNHPPFDPGSLARPHLAAQLEAPPPEPRFAPPPTPNGVMRLFGKQQHQEAVETARQTWAAEQKRWSDYVKFELPEKNTRLQQEHAAKERSRLAELQRAEAEYRESCAEREREAAEANKKVDSFRFALAANNPDAITQYVGVVLGNSVYPEAFNVEHEFSFDAEEGELKVAVFIPAPPSVPTIKSVKYVAASDELRETHCSQREQRDMYNGAVAAVALRTFHEVFESDRKRWINTISLTVETEAPSPATGLMETYYFVAAAADREEFFQFNLHRVNPVDTLAHMRSSISKNPFGLVSIAPGLGIRRA